MKRLNGVDALMLYTETPEIHMHTLKIGVLDVSDVGGYDFDLFRAVALRHMATISQHVGDALDDDELAQLTALCDKLRAGVASA